MRQRRGRVEAETEYLPGPERTRPWPLLFRSWTFRLSGATGEDRKGGETTATIQAEFDPASLPAWARKYPEVVALAERNLAFRCDVYHASSSLYKRLLVRTARRRLGDSWMRKDEFPHQ